MRLAINENCYLLTHLVEMNDNRLLTEQELKVVYATEHWRLRGGVFGGKPPARTSTGRAGVEPHCHPYRELMVVLDGCGAYGLRGECYPCRPGDIFLVEENVPHDVGYAVDAPDLRHLWVSILAGRLFLRQVAVRKGRMTGFPQRRVTLRVETIGDHIYHVLTRAWPRPESASSGDRFALKTAIAAVLAAYADTGWRGPEKPPCEKDVQEQAVSAVCAHLRHTAGAGDSVASLARLAGYSPYHFHRLFRGFRGESVHNYIDRCRLVRVQQRRTEGRRMKEIAHELGFSCPASFSRWWRSHRHSI